MTGGPRGVGGMRQRLELQREQKTPDGAGGYLLDWETVDTVWAEVRPTGARERATAMRLRSEITHRVVIRYRADMTLDGEWRLRSDGRAFNVRAAIDLEERHRFWELLCEEGVAI